MICLHKHFLGLFLFKRLVFRSASLDGSEGHFRLSEVSVKLRKSGKHGEHKLS